MKKETKASKIMKYIASNPTAKARDIAKALKVSVDSVYQTTYLAKRQAKSNLSSVPRKRGKPIKNLRSRLDRSITELTNKLNKARIVDSVNHPPHYKAGGIETIDFIEAKSLNYNLGNVIKYITRADLKGNKLEDLKKAQWYLNREVQTMEKSK
jgi:predicted transcriptional regulator